MEKVTPPIIPFYKEPESYEIACMFFENCNLKCNFCFESHINKKIDTKYIENLHTIIYDNFRKEYEKYPSIKTVYLMLWGGEIFFDSLSDEIFNSYYKFVDNINSLFKLHFSKLNILFSWLSNGVFNKRKRVLDLVNYSKGIINLSYDPCNRFKTKTQLNTMLESAKYFKENNVGKKISITLTKSSIQAFINDKSHLKYFKELGYNIDLNYYIANPNWEELLPTDEEIFSFFEWAIKNKLYEIKVLERLFQYFCKDNISKYCDCQYCSQITHGEWSVDCATCSSLLPRESFYGEYTQNITEENTNKIKATLGLQKRGCLTCKYYNRCQMFCWIAIVFNKFKPTICPYKRVYEYIENNKEVLIDYLDWRNGY
jgi:hypothetical protein